MKKPNTAGVNAGSFSLSKKGIKKSSADGKGNNLSSFSLENKSVPSSSGIVNQPDKFAFSPGSAAASATGKGKLK